MFIPSTLEIVREKHPKEFDAAIVVFRRSRSKRNGEPLVSFTWGYEYCVQAPALSLGDVLSGEAEKLRDEREAHSLEERVQDYERRVSTCIVGKLGSCTLIESSPLGTVPEVILDEYRKHEKAREAEGRRFAALCREDQQREMQRTLRQLGRDPGFVAISVPRGKP